MPLTTVTSKGQLTVPASVRKALKLGARSRINIELCGDGTALLRPLPDASSVFGALRDPNRPYDSEETAKAQAIAARKIAREGRGR